MEIEQSLLGAILIREGVMDTVSEMVAPKDFYRPAHGLIYQAILDLYQRQEPVDVVTVTQRLQTDKKLEEIGGPVFLSGLADQVGTAANAPYYARIVRERSVVRAMRERAGEIVAACDKPIDNLNEFLDYAESRIYDVLEVKINGQAKFFSELIPQETAILEQAYYSPQDPGIRTGFTDLDVILTGLCPSDLILLAARPGQGKTAMAVNIAYTAAMAGKTVGFVSLEMSESQIVRRFLASAGRIDGERLRRVSLSQSEWVKLSEVAGILKSLPIQIDDATGLTVLDIRARARRLKYRQGLDLLIVDYLQLIKPHKGRSREQEVTAISQALKSLAKELKIPVLALCQLNRDVEKRDNKRHRLSDLRESGSLEQDADVVIFISRNESLADVDVAKQRNGRTGRIKLVYAENFIRFDNYAGE